MADFSTRHLAAIILTGLIWGSSGVWIKEIPLDPLEIATFRLVFPALVAGVLLAVCGKLPDLRSSPRLISGSLIGAVKTYFYMYGFSHASLGAAATINALWPLLTVMCGYFFLGERSSWVARFALGVGSLGVVSIHFDEFYVQQGSWLGLLAVLIAAILTAISTTLFKQDLRHFSSLQVIFVRNAIGAICLFPFAFFAFSRPISFLVLGQGVFFAMTIGFFAFLLYYYGLRKLPLYLATPLTNVEVVAAIFFATFLLNEPMSGYRIAGSFFIISSILLLAFERQIGFLFRRLIPETKNPG